MIKCKLCSKEKFYIVKKLCYLCKILNNINYCKDCKNIKKYYDQDYCKYCFFKIVKSKL